MRAQMQCKYFYEHDTLITVAKNNRHESDRGEGVRLVSTKKETDPFGSASSFRCGDGRTRTAVQTPHQRAFYTLSLPLVFDQGLPADRLSKAYPLNLSGA